MDAKQIIAKRVALELKNGELVNLGIGLPTMVADYLPEGVEVILQSENGMIGMGHIVSGPHNRNFTNAGGTSVTILPHGACFDSAFSFCLIRGGHVDGTVLGTLEVDQHGNIANYMIPGKMVPGMGGAMDLVTGSRKVIVVTTHTDKSGNSKILKQCSLPLTGVACCDLIVTELAVIEVTPNGLKLLEIADNTTVEEVIAKTEAPLILAEPVKTFSTN
ncbi:MAG: 3-oxoacid CoA-transferase subunit B [Burkholderiales bacterium]|nr:3-oxoacid CoA-transferase subunit B [Burkholderiales bacterium]